MSHFELANEFVAMTKRRGSPTIWYWRNEWYEWTGQYYEARSRSDMERRVLDWLIATGQPSRLSDVRSVLSILRLSQEISSKSGSDLGNSDCLTVQNGILRLGDRTSLLRHTPRFMGFTRTDYDFDPKATCPMWEAFLHQLWPKDSTSVALLQEWFGYCLLNDTSHQKMLAIVGRPRSGKSTIGRVLRGVLGSQSVASPSIRSLSGQFGLWGLLDKTLAIIPDATMTSPSPALEELLKSISGEDPIDIHRKDLPPITSVRLPTRLMILANALPSFRDTSGALASRILLLRTETSFAQKEDRLLSERLLTELSGLLNWSIQGLRRLRRQGRFTQPLIFSTTRRSRGQKVRDIVLELVDTLGLNQRKRPTNRRKPRKVRPK